MWHSIYRAHKDRLVAQAMPWLLLGMLVAFGMIVVYPQWATSGGSVHPAQWQNDLRVCEYTKDDWKSVIACMRARGWQSPKQEWWE